MDPVDPVDPVATDARDRLRLPPSSNSDFPGKANPATPLALEVFSWIKRVTWGSGRKITNSALHFIVQTAVDFTSLFHNLMALEATSPN